MIKIYNTLTRKKEEFKPVKKGEVGLYSCGPTVYNYVHIGNLRAYIFVDLLKRYLVYRGFKVNHVMNITDVDDKTIRDSQKEKKSLKEFTEFYTKEFLKDLEKLNILPADLMPRATESVDGMVKLIKVLLAKGFAYKTEKGDIYFKISKFKDYGKLALIDPDKLKQNAAGRLEDEYDKEDARDFALWKNYNETDGDVFWETDLGKGRPGWHIECSVMSKQALGQPFDIHTGGVDLVFPHHTNEIAQSECAYGKKFVNYWLHNEHLLVNGQKMSKSKGNFYTLKDLKKYKPEAIRFELLRTHYRTKLDFREDELEQIPNTLQKFYDFMIKLKEADGNCKKIDSVDSLIDKAKEDFETAMDDDLNISSGLAAIFEFMTEINKIMDKLSKEDAKNVKDTMNSFDSVLSIMKQEDEIPAEIMKVVKEREIARKELDWAKSDRLRSELNKLGYHVEDSKKGSRVKRL
ncbi:MAG: cysteine--tRNA ligase [Nanoarchaeota archaeon]|nr:cysteine--tRNA ligase [Nanoarchaeota archaeon]